MIHGTQELLGYSYRAESLCRVLLGVILTIQNLIVSHCTGALLILVEYCREQSKYPGANPLPTLLAECCCCYIKCPDIHIILLRSF